MFALNQNYVHSTYSRFEIFRERVITQLHTALEEININFLKISQQINSVEPVDYTTVGFADIHAKARIINIAAKVLDEKSYAQLSKVKRLDLYRLFHDDTDEEIFQRQKFSKKNILKDYLKLPSFADLNEYAQATDKFLRAWEAGKVYPTGNPKIQLVECPPEDKIFTDPFEDVEMSDDAETVLENDAAIGSTGMASCLSIKVFVHRENDVPIVGVKHDPMPTLKGIKKFIEATTKNNNATKNSVSSYLLGGVIVNLPACLTILSKAKQLGIEDVSIGLINTFLESHKGVVRDNKPGQLSFAVESYLPNYNEYAEDNHKEAQRQVEALKKYSPTAGFQPNGNQFFSKPKKTEAKATTDSNSSGLSSNNSSSSSANGSNNQTPSTILTQVAKALKVHKREELAPKDDYPSKRMRV